MPGLSAHFRDVVSPSRNTLAEWLLRATDVGLFGVFFVTALTLGGRHDGGRFVYALSVALAALTLSWRSVLLGKPIRTPRWPTVLVLLAIAVPTVQLLPLPGRWLAMVAPGHAGLLPLWTAEGAIGAWKTISLAPYETLEGLALLLAHAVLFFTVINRVERESDARRLLIGIGIGAVVMALIAIAQYTASNGRLLWLYNHPYSRFDGQVQGTFVNRNHLAHYLAFGAAGLTPLLLGGVTRSRRSRAGRHREAGLQQQTGLVLGFFALAVVLATILGTMSRGGLVALSSGFTIAVVLRGISGRLRLKEGVALAALATIVLMAVSFFNYDRVTARFSNLVSGQIEELDHGAGRRLIWEANLSALAANPWLGHGAGGHRYYYGAYIAQPATKEFTHAESSYLQVASECGIAGLAVLAIAIISFGWWVARGLWEAQTDQQVTLWCALGAGLGISLAHAVVDFVWYLPSLAALVIAFAALAWRLRELQERESLVAPASESRRFQPGGKWCYGDLLKVSIAAMSVSVALTCLSGPAAGSLKWDKYLRVASSVRAQQKQVIELDGDARANHDASIEDSQRRAAALLSGMLAVDHNNARAHLRYADRCIQAFAYESGRGANPMSIEQIRDTFRVGGFGEHAHALAWLDKAIGDSAKRLHAAHLHASLAMRLNPLEARAYLILAELDFLSLNGSSIDVLIGQAIRLRPLDGGLRYAVGRRLHSAGRLDEALEQYRLCLSLPGSHRQQLLMALAPIIPASALLESLQPDGPATEIVFAAYRRLIASEERAGHPDLVAISIHAKQLAEQTDGGSPGELARNWSRLSLLHREIASNDEAVVCAERAYELQPHNFWVRHELGLSLYQAERYNDADKHLRWCLARRPDLRYLQRMMKLTSKKIGEAERRRQDEVRRELRLASLEEGHDAASNSSTGEPQNVERQ